MFSPLFFGRTDGSFLRPVQPESRGMAQVSTVSVLLKKQGGSCKGSFPQDPWQMGKSHEEELLGDVM